MQCLFVSTSLRVSIIDLDISLSTRVTVSTRDTGEAYLQDIVKLFYNHPLLISQFKLPQDRFTPLCELVNCLSMFQGIIQHVKGRVPMGCNIPWQVGDAHMELFQDVTPGWKYNSGQVDDLIAKFMKLSKLSDLPVRQHCPHLP